MGESADDKFFRELMLGEGTKVRELIGTKYSLDDIAEVLNEMKNQTEQSVLDMSEVQFDAIHERLRMLVYDDEISDTANEVINESYSERIKNYYSCRLDRSFENNDKDLFMRITNEMKLLKGGDVR